MIQDRKLEALTSLATLAVCILTAGVLVWRFVIPPSVGSSRAKVPVGQHLRLSDVDWTAAPKTAVLVLSTKCHFCTESAPFFRDLVTTAHARKVRVIAVLPQDRNEAMKYLGSLDLQFDGVFSAPLDRVGAKATPTVLLVGTSGAVLDGWIGAVHGQGEAKLLNKL